MTISLYLRKKASYSEHPDLLKWINADITNPLSHICEIIKDGPRVLDVGCGSGILGRLIKNKNKKTTISGIDPSVSPDKIGLSVYDNFHQGNLEEALDNDWVLNNQWFVFADVVEHLPYPDIILTQLVSKTASDSRYVFSVPNVAHFSNRLSLMNGSWNYTDSGILESTHVRFYTVDSFIQLLNHIGLFPIRIILLNRLTPPIITIEPPSIRDFFESALMSGIGHPFCYQFIIEAAKIHHEEPQIISIGKEGKLSLLAFFLKNKLNLLP